MRLLFGVPAVHARMFDCGAILSGPFDSGREVLNEVARRARSTLWGEITTSLEGLVCGDSPTRTVAARRFCPALAAGAAARAQRRAEQRPGDTAQSKHGQALPQARRGVFYVHHPP